MLLTSEQKDHACCLHQAVLPYFLMWSMSNFILNKICNKKKHNFLSMVIESQLSVIWDTKKTKRYQQKIPTYLQFSERCKTLYIFRLTLYVNDP